MAATPFLQAVATHFGTKLAGAIDETTRVAVRRFLRREAALDQGGSADPQAPIALRTDAGWALLIPVDVPAEALGQLLALQNATPPVLSTDPTPRMAWRESAWWVTGVNFGAIVELRWDPEAGWSEF
jgi:hypothetical protein